MRGHQGRCGLLCAAFAVAAAAGPGSVWAALSPSEKGPSFGLEVELSRLDEIRERLVRRRALQRALDQRVESLAAEIDALQARREHNWATLRSERDEAQALALRLDHLVPRVLARQAAVQKRRAQAARLLADLASTGRQVQLDPTIRARMLAISPLMLRRLQSAESGLSVLERQPDRLIARQEEIERRVPLLMAEAQRLQRRREQTRRQRQIVSARLEQVTAEVQQLSSSQQVLAQNHEVTHSAHAGPKADQPALPDVAMRPAAVSVLDAAVKGLLAERPRLAFAVHAVQPASSQLVAVAPRSVALTPPDATVYAGLQAVAPPPAKPVDALLEGALGTAAPSLHAEVEGLTPLDLVFLQPGPLADVDSRVALARLQRPQAPIMPVPGEVASPFSDRGGADLKPGIRIAAAPGQAVAAPEGGRVVFAGTFKSYGLLLIIEHQREYHTLLWGFSRLDVAIGDPVWSGQIVGVMAADPERPVELHVELRRNGRPVTPLPWLAASSNKVRG
jgi:murein DD-endopeptidase MepM/ murein hydrolase activator NlpD